MALKENSTYGIKRNNPLRYTYGFILGISFRFILDIFFSLKYTQGLSLSPVVYYFYTIILCFVIIESLLRINSYINHKLQWENNLYQKAVQQFLIDSHFAILFVFTSRWTYRYLINDHSYVVAKDELTILFFVYIVVLGFVLTDLAYFLMFKWRNSLAELEKFKKENAEYKFELLQSQLNPHFLFNSLNTLSSLVYENQDNAGLFIRKLSDVYRYILDHRDTDLVSLKTEIGFAESYILLMKLRFEDNLEIEIDTKEIDIDSYQIAPLSLQLLLENAFKHNIVSKRKPLNIRIYSENGFIIVSNNKQAKLSHEKSHQMGLKNLQSRFQFLTEESIQIEDKETDFIVRLPLIPLR